MKAQHVQFSGSKNRLRFSQFRLPTSFQRFGNIRDSMSLLGAKEQTGWRESRSKGAGIDRGTNLNNVEVVGPSIHH